MNAPVLPEMLVQRGERPQGELPLASEGVLRYVWESRFGPMLIEVRQGRAYVNEEAVEPAEPPAGAPSPTCGRGPG
jgi:hypothetical protein